jgi:hypothetical protein
VLDQEGNIMYIIQLATNVTDMITAEQAMHEKQLKEKIMT